MLLLLQGARRWRSLDWRPASSNVSTALGDVNFKLPVRVLMACTCVLSLMGNRMKGKEPPPVDGVEYKSVLRRTPRKQPHAHCLQFFPHRALFAQATLCSMCKSGCPRSQRLSYATAMDVSACHPLCCSATSCISALTLWTPFVHHHHYQLLTTPCGCHGALPSALPSKAIQSTSLTVRVPNLGRVVLWYCATD